MVGKELNTQKSVYCMCIIIVGTHVALYILKLVWHAIVFVLYTSHRQIHAIIFVPLVGRNIVCILSYFTLECPTDTEVLLYLWHTLQALEDEKCIASAHWLNDILTDQKMYPPRRALHFPTAFKWQLPGARDYVSLE